eukprot:UN30847
MKGWEYEDVNEWKPFDDVDCFMLNTCDRVIYLDENIRVEKSMKLYEGKKSVESEFLRELEKDQNLTDLPDIRIVTKINRFKQEKSHMKHQSLVLCRQSCRKSVKVTDLKQQQKKKKKTATVLLVNFGEKKISLICGTKDSNG